MTLRLVGVENAGEMDNERVVLQALSEVSVGNYILLHTKGTPDGKVFSGPISNAYWFETLTAKSGDFVVLYSKSGSRSQKPGPTGMTSHFFYWGLHSPAWKDGFKPTIIRASTWEWK